nr:GNAT family N-acetyltransferase [uncultured Blautia sp.]
MSSSVTIRPATPADAEELLSIYAPYVEHTAITFEYEVPSVEEFRERILHTLQHYPYLVAEKTITNSIVGYVYAGPLHVRAAYAWSVETSIYVKEGEKNSGIGKILYTALEKALAAQNMTNLNACIASPLVDDEYLNHNSIQFHEHLGYSMVGEFHKCAYKFGRWYNMVWMEKMIAGHSDRPADVIPFGQIPPEVYC